MSLRWSMSRLDSHASGDMYCGVPRTTPAAVSLAEAPSWIILASPKSSTLTKSRSPRRSSSMMLSGLRSRWMMPQGWAGARGRPLGGQDVGEGAPLEVLHDVEVLTLRALPEVVDLDDVLVADLVDRA